MPASADDVVKLLAGAGPARLRLGKVSHFPGDTHDVVYVEVESPDADRLHGTLANSLVHVQTHPNYVKHVTLAYVKPGLGPVWAHRLGRIDRDVLATHCAYSDRDGTRTVIPLGSVGKADDGAMSSLVGSAGGFLVPDGGACRKKVRRKGRGKAARRLAAYLRSVVKALPGDDPDSAPDPHSAAAAMVAWVKECRSSGVDPAAGLNHIADSLYPAGGDDEDDDGDTVEKAWTEEPAFHPEWSVLKAFDVGELADELVAEMA